MARRRWRRPPLSPPRRRERHRRVRVVVRRTRLTDRAQAQLWPDWRYHAFATSAELSPAEADAFHRAPCPSGVGHPGHQSPRRSLALPLGELLRQRRLAGLHGTGSQPLQMDRTPHQPGRTINQREHRPHPPLSPPRQDREPRRKTDTPPTRQMALADTYLTTLASIRSLPQLC